VACSLFKYKLEEATHWVGRTGKLYPVKDYVGHGKGGVDQWGFKDLPKDEYPFTIIYKTESLFLCCKLCNCEGRKI